MIRNVEYGDRKKHQRTYLDGIEEIQEQRVRITIDGVECPEKEWEKIFEMGEDGGFIWETMSAPNRAVRRKSDLTKCISATLPKRKKR